MKIAMFHNIGLNEGQIRDEEHIAKGFRNLGHTVYQNELPEKVDLILVFKSNNVSIDKIKEWKKIAPVWFWSFDNMDRCPNWYEVIKECDKWLGEELGRRERFVEQGLPFYYFPNHAAPPDVFYKVDTPKTYDVVFAGSAYDCQYKPDKFELLRQIQAKYNLFVFGNREWEWKAKGIHNIFPAAFDQKLSQIYGQSKIVLAMSNVQCEGYWSIRTTQALLCGAFVLARYTPQMEKELKDNVVYYTTISDCLNRIGDYLADNEERKRIAQKGYEYAQKYLTTEQRLKELIILYENQNNITR